jgi:aldehyde:ferredoxin oxidoreductase
MWGWKGKILRVDLSAGTVEDEALDPKVARDFIGGRGLGIYYLLKEVDPDCDPFAPENVLVMATGPLTGTKAPTGARYMVMTKSPLTGAITCSNAGGHFPAEIKKAGYDAILFKGCSRNPVYLWIENGKAELRSAADLWGKAIPSVHRKLIGETHPKARIACIGPAGENRVLFASIMNDRHRAAGRSGVGAVMGSKNLKAVVVHGDEKIQLADEKRFKEFTNQVLKGFKAGGTPPLRINGTAGTVAATQNFGILPTKNWQKGTFDGWEKINGTVLTEKYLVKAKSCFSCPIGCGRGTEIKDGPYKGKGEGPEYETIYAMGSNCLIDDLAAITKANYICNELGLDTMTMGATLACAMELYEKGALSEKEVGRPLLWGDADALIEFTEKTAYREGFGDALAEGSFRLAEKCGHPEMAIVSKKQEFAAYEPRGEQGMGLAYATSPIGGSHMRGDPAYAEIFGIPEPVDPHDWKGKAKLVKSFQDLSTVIDSAGLCIFFSVRNLATKDLAVRPDGVLELLNSATGVGFSLEELEKSAERIWNAERLFLVKAGFSRKDDSLPKRLTHEPMPDGPAKGNVCHIEEMLDEYYTLQNWTEDGIPKQEKLTELGLGQNQIP